MMFSRGGYASSQCLYRKLKWLEWKAKHAHGKLKCNVVFWTIKEFLKIFLETQEKNMIVPSESSLKFRAGKSIYCGHSY